MSKAQTAPNTIKRASQLAGKTVAIVGGGPAGLFAADLLLTAGAKVSMFDAMGSVGRKFLIAGKGGLNLTHSEPKAQFEKRYGGSLPVALWLAEFDADDLRAFAKRLGFATMIGSSGRVFPTDMKAAPMLRTWVRELRERGLQMHHAHRLTDVHGQGDAAHAAPTALFQTADGTRHITADAMVLALGGGSWAKLGSTGAWVELLRQRGAIVADLAPSNCGFTVRWSDTFRQKCAGQPIKTALLRVGINAVQSEIVVSEYGLEGSGIYALSAELRTQILASGSAELGLDLFPHLSTEALAIKLQRERGKRSFSEHLKRCINLTGVRLQLVYECVPNAASLSPAELATALKSLLIRLTGMQPIDDAISTAGGVHAEALTPTLMLAALPGVFCAGEMLDWDAPTGGYLLTACFASGMVAAKGVVHWLTCYSNPD